MPRLKVTGALAMLAFLVALPGSAHAAELVVNGGFEDPHLADGEEFRTVRAGHAAEELAGWTVTHESIDMLGTTYQAASGTQSIDLNGDAAGGVKQTIPTVAGKRYIIRYSMASNAESTFCTNATEPKTMDVSFNGTVIEQATFTPDANTAPTNMQWQPHELQADATASATEIVFRSTTSHPYCGPAIDQVSVTEVGSGTPPPGPGPTPPGPGPTPGGSPAYRVQAIEVTQGTQFMFLGSGGNMGSGGGALFAPGVRASTYSGVNLAAGGETVVRVYAESNVFVGARLTVRNASGAVKQLVSDLSPSFVDQSARSAAQKQQSSAGAFNFWLPKELVTGKITLDAQLVPVDGAETCGSADCAPARLSSVSFKRVKPFTIRVVRMLTRQWQKAVTGDPVGEIHKALRMVPHEAGALKVVDTQQTIDVSSTAEGTETCIAWRFNCHKRTSDEARDEAFSKLHWWDWAGTPKADLTIGLTNETWGVANGTHMGTVGRCRNGTLWLCNRPVAMVAIGSGRTRGNIAHEIVHALGRPHASKACKGAANGQIGESWPPDEKGRLNGVGFDFDAEAVGRGGRRVVPSAAFAAGKEPTPAEYNAVPVTSWSYDLMSYCWAENNVDEANVWISPYNWNKLVDFLSKGVKGRPAAARTATASAVGRGAAADERLQILAFRTAGGKTTVTDVVPGTGLVVAGPPGGPRAVVYDKDNDVVSSTPMVVNSGHADSASPVPVEIMGAQVPGSAAARVTIVQGKKVIAEERASKHAPKGRLKGIRRGARLGKKEFTTVQWRASDADRRSELTILLEASVRGRWQRVFAGPDPAKHRTRLPRNAFPKGRGRLRLTVSDGLRFHRSTSPKLRFVGIAP